MAVLLTSGGLLAGCVAAGAQTGTQAPIVVPNTADLNTFQSIQRAEQFQADQRRNRNDDRMMNTQPVPRQQVPVMRPSCQYGFNGSPSTRSGC